MTTYETLLVETQGAVTLVRLNRPQALNAISPTVQDELIEAFAAYDTDPGQRCLVLTGSEKAFAAGADIKAMQDVGFSGMFAQNFFAGFDRLAFKLEAGVLPEVEVFAHEVADRTDAPAA